MMPGKRLQPSNEIETKDESEKIVASSSRGTVLQPIQNLKKQFFYKLEKITDGFSKVEKPVCSLAIYIRR